MMKYTSFREFEIVYSKPYSQKMYKEALDLLEKAEEVLPQEEYKKHLFIIMLDKVRLFLELEMYDECISTFNDMMDLRFACPLHWKRFELLEDDPRFNKIKEKNDLLLEEARKRAKFKYEVHLPKDYSDEKQYPLFFNLHGDGADGNIGDHSWYWRPDALVEKGFIVVYPQSSQVYCHNGHGWLIDPLVARREIKTCYENITNEYSIDKKRIIIGGFSGGANAAVDIVMANVIPLRGFISLCPGKSVKSFSKDYTEYATKRGDKGVIIEGENDIEPRVKDMLKEFDKVGFPYKYHVCKGLGHWYPDDLDEIVNEAVEFILE